MKLRNDKAQITMILDDDEWTLYNVELCRENPALCKDNSAVASEFLKLFKSFSDSEKEKVLREIIKEMSPSWVE